MCRKCWQIRSIINNQRAVSSGGFLLCGNTNEHTHGNSNGNTIGNAQSLIKYGLQRIGKTHAETLVNTYAETRTEHKQEVKK